MSRQSHVSCASSSLAQRTPTPNRSWILSEPRTSLDAKPSPCWKVKLQPLQTRSSPRRFQNPSPRRRQNVSKSSPERLQNISKSGSSQCRPYGEPIKITRLQRSLRHLQFNASAPLCRPYGEPIKITRLQRSLRHLQFNASASLGLTVSRSKSHVPAVTASSSSTHPHPPAVNNLHVVIVLQVLADGQQNG